MTYRSIKQTVFSLVLAVLVLFILSCTPEHLLTISHNNNKLAWMGRIGHTDSTAVICWSGSSVSMNFEGTEVQAMLKDEKGRNYFNVIIDSTTIIRFKPDTVKKLYTLVSNLKPGRHNLQLFKITEAANGKTWLYYLTLKQGDSLLPPPPPKTKKIEFYGNSITAGYSLEDTTGDSGNPKYTNNYLSYAAVTARHYNADYRCISKSGIGIMISWNDIIMPEMYDRTDIDDSTTKWDFSQYTPNIVVISLLQNDSWLTHKPEHPQFKKRFGTTPPTEEQIIEAYRNFVKTIRSKYPNTSIICVLGSMDATKQGSVWPGYIEKAVATLNDKKIYTYFFPYKNSPGHPKVKEQQAMADSLVSFIDSHVTW